MNTRTFENLDFSFLVEVDKQIAWLQEWDDGNWGDPEIYRLPLALEGLNKESKLARALKSFRRDPQFEELRDALRCGLPEPVPDPAPSFRDFWTGVVTRFAPNLFGWVRT